MLARSLLLLGVAAATASAGNVECPTSWLYTTQCIRKPDTASSWYHAESVCRGFNPRSHVAAAWSDATASNLLYQLKAAGYKQAWIGVYKEAGRWRWADGTAFDTFPRLVDTTDFRDAAGRCISVKVLPAGLKAVALDCSATLPYLCSLGSEGCAFSTLSLRFKGGVGAASDSYDITIKPSGVLSLGGIDAGLGEWTTPSTFRVVSPGAYAGCTWFARFSYSKGVATVVTGCETSPGVLASPRTGAFMEQPSCDRGHKLGGETTPAPATGMPAGRVPGPETGITVEDDNAKFVNAKTKEGDDDSSGVPVWIWPVSFGVVAAVSAMAAIGAARRRGKSPKSSEDEEMGEVPGRCDGPSPRHKHSENAKHTHDPEAAVDCDTCRKFNVNMARMRLRAVHEALQREFSRPLGVLDTRCDHVGNDHVHVFTVENAFDASSLGALSTVYSRTKPRLPRNTRIHIERGVQHRFEEAELKLGDDTQFEQGAFQWE